MAVYDRAFDLSDIDDMEGHDFEQFVAKRLVNEGYTDVEVTQGSGDFGVDIVAKHDDAWYAIQVKRHSNNVSHQAVSDAVAGIKHYGCSEAMVVTNSRFEKSANEFANSVGCELIERDTLCDWIARFQTS